MCDIFPPKVAEVVCQLRLFVGGLPPDTTSLEMYQIFSAFGPIAPRGATWWIYVLQPTGGTPKNRTLGWLKCVKKLFPYFALDIIDYCWPLLILIVGGFMWFEICYRRLMVSNFGLWPPKMVDYSWTFKNVWVLSCLGSWFNEIFSGASWR